MAHLSDPHPRVLKIEEVGDFYRNRTKSQIRLKGNWLAQAGMLPNHYVQVENPQNGVLVIRLIDSSD